MRWTKPTFKFLWSKTRFDFETDVRISQRRASPWLSPLIVPDEPQHEAKHTRSTASSYAAPSRFTVYRYGQPWFVAFSKGFASGIVSAIKKRGEESSYHEGTEKPNKRSYEHSARMVLAPIKAAPQRRHSAPSEHVHYWGDGGLPDKPHKFLVETYDLRLKAWVTTTSYDWQCVAESIRKPHQRIRVVADAASGYKTVQILHNDPRLPVA